MIDIDLNNPYVVGCMILIAVIVIGLCIWGMNRMFNTSKPEIITTQQKVPEVTETPSTLEVEMNEIPEIPDAPEVPTVPQPPFKKKFKSPALKNK